MQESSLQGSLSVQSVAEAQETQPGTFVWAQTPLTQVSVVQPLPSLQSAAVVHSGCRVVDVVLDVVQVLDVEVDDDVEVEDVHEVLVVDEVDEVLVVVFFTVVLVVVGPSQSSSWSRSRSAGSRHSRRRGRDCRSRRRGGDRRRSRHTRTSSPSPRWRVRGRASRWPRPLRGNTARTRFREKVRVIGLLTFR